MRLATFNILHGAVPGADRVDPSALAAAVAELDADLLALQEVDRGQARSGGVDLTAVAAAAMGARDHRFAAAMSGTPGTWTPATGDEPGDAPAYGVALLSRFPVSDWRVVRLPGAPVQVPYRFPGGRPTLVVDEARVGLVAEVVTPEGSLRAVATHLSFLGLWNGRQLRRLVREVVEPGVPTVVMGDLNLGPARATRTTGLEPLATADTFPAHAPVRQIDHLLGQGVRGLGGRAVPLPLSDHLALVAEV